MERKPESRRYGIALTLMSGDMPRPPTPMNTSERNSQALSRVGRTCEAWDPSNIKNFDHASFWQSVISLCLTSVGEKRHTPHRRGGREVRWCGTRRKKFEGWGEGRDEKERETREKGTFIYFTCLPSLDRFAHGRPFLLTLTLTLTQPCPPDPGVGEGKALG